MPPEEINARDITWGVLGTANIAARAFLPALRAAGGHAGLVGSRDPRRAREWADEHGVSGATGYPEVIAAPDIDAVYIALPNDQHVEWAVRAADAGKAVLCEKPLGLTPAEVSRLASTTNPRVWESFVFPFHPQTAQLVELLAGGEIGEWREVQSEFHFRLTDPANLRFSAGHGGGALFDVGCYPIRLARLLFGAEPERAQATATFAGPTDGLQPEPAARPVDVEIAGVLDFPAGRRLLFSAGFGREPSTFTRILGETGELRLGNPFHPTATDGIELWRGRTLVRRYPAAAGTAFQHAIDHIHRVLSGQAEPRHTVGTDALGQARALELVQAAVTPGSPAPNTESGSDR